MQLSAPPTFGVQGLANPEAAALVRIRDISPHPICRAVREADIFCIHVVATEVVRADNQLDEPGVVRISHTGQSPFYTSDIDLVLRSNGIKTLFIIGDPLAARRFAYDAQRNGYSPVMIQAEEAPIDALGVPLSQLSEAEFMHLLAGTPAGPRNWHEDVKAHRMRRPFSARVAPQRTALILIDVLNDFCIEGGGISKTDAAMPRVTAALPRIRNLLEGARRAGAHVLHVQAIYGPMFRSQGSPYRFPSTVTREGAVWCASAADIEEETPPFDPALTEVCKEGTWGCDFVDGMQPINGETVIRKHRYSALRDTALNGELRRRGVETVILAGVTTNCCVESTARDLSMCDYDAVIAEDCVAVKDLVVHLHEASLEQIQTYFGVVTPSQRILDLWK